MKGVISLKIFIKLFFEFIFTIIGILFLCCFPFLFLDPQGVHINVEQFLRILKSTVLSLTEPHLLMYPSLPTSISKDVIFTSLLPFNEEIKQSSTQLLPLFPHIIAASFYSLTILTGALVLAVILSIVISQIYMISSNSFKKFILKFLFLLESIPDVMILIFLQMFIIWLFKSTGILIFNIASLNDNHSYVIPILCLSTIPCIQLFRFLILNLEEEQNKNYYEFAISKGLTKSYVIFFHLLRNVLLHLFYHSRVIFISMLSSLLVLEYILNIQGIMFLLLRYGVYSPPITAVGLISIYIPFYFIFCIASLIIQKITNRGEAI